MGQKSIQLSYRYRHSPQQESFPKVFVSYEFSYENFVMS